MITIGNNEKKFKQQVHAIRNILSRQSSKASYIMLLWIIMWFAYLYIVLYFLLSTWGMCYTTFVNISTWCTNVNTSVMVKLSWHISNIVGNTWSNFIIFWELSIPWYRLILLYMLSVLDVILILTHISWGKMNICLNLHIYIVSHVSGNMLFRHLFGRRIFVSHTWCSDLQEWK